MNDIMQMAEGRLGRILAIRLLPGTDLLHGLEEACRRAKAGRQEGAQKRAAGQTSITA